MIWLIRGLSRHPAQMDRISLIPHSLKERRRGRGEATDKNTAASSKPFRKSS